MVRRTLLQSGSTSTTRWLLTSAEPLPATPSVFCSGLTGASPGVVCCRSPSASRSDAYRVSSPLPLNTKLFISSVSLSFKGTHNIYLLEHRQTKRCQEQISLPNVVWLTGPVLKPVLMSLFYIPEKQKEECWWVTRLVIWVHLTSVCLYVELYVALVQIEDLPGQWRIFKGTFPTVSLAAFSGWCFLLPPSSLKLCPCFSPCAVPALVLFLLPQNRNNFSLKIFFSLSLLLDLLGSIPPPVAPLHCLQRNALKRIPRLWSIANWQQKNFSFLLSWPLKARKSSYIQRITYTWREHIKAA